MACLTKILQVIRDQFVKHMPELSYSFRCGQIHENDCHEFGHTQKQQLSVSLC
jgi:hypothetical protein